MKHNISNQLEITSYIHCKECLKSLPENKSPREYAQLDIGFTKIGLQVWCTRHNLNVMYIDFEGYRHPINLNTMEKEKEDGAKQ